MAGSVADARWMQEQGAAYWPSGGLRSTGALASMLYILVPVDIALRLLYGLLEPAGVAVGPQPLDALRLLVQFASALVGITTIVTALVWVHRTVHNARAFAGTEDPSPGWAVGSWFIPVVHLYEPFRVVRDAWVKSGVGALPVVYIWWATFGGSLLLGYVGSIWAFAFAASSFPVALVALQWSTHVLYLIGGVAFLAVVRQFQDTQDEASAQADASSRLAAPAGA